MHAEFGEDNMSTEGDMLLLVKSVFFQHCKIAGIISP